MSFTKALLASKSAFVVEDFIAILWVGEVGVLGCDFVSTEELEVSCLAEEADFFAIVVYSLWRCW